MDLEKITLKKRLPSQNTSSSKEGDVDKRGNLEKKGDIDGSFDDMQYVNKQYVENLLQIARDISKTPYGSFFSSNILLNDGSLNPEDLLDRIRFSNRMTFYVNLGNNNSGVDESGGSNGVSSDRVIARQFLYDSHILRYDLHKALKYKNPKFEINYSGLTGVRSDDSPDESTYHKVRSIIVRNSGFLDTELTTLLDFNLEDSGLVTVKLAYDLGSSERELKKLEKAVNVLKNNNYSAGEDTNIRSAVTEPLGKADKVHDNRGFIKYLDFF